MPLFFIVGAAGTGKSSVKNELKERGYEAYDTDERGYGMAQWQNNKTGYVHPKSSVKSEARTEEFLNEHSWKVTEPLIEELAAYVSDDKVVFLCGNVANEKEISDISRATFALVVDRDTLEQRILNRTDNNWGKQPHELQQTLDELERANKTYVDQGDTIIDASKPIKAVVDGILATAKLK